MANYTQYIPQLNSTTYPVSITDAFTALTTDITALEDGKLSLTGGTLTGGITISSGTITIGSDTAAVVDATLTNLIMVSADSSGRLTTSSGIVATNVVERNGALTSGDVAVVTTNNDIQSTGIVAANVVERSGTLTSGELVIATAGNDILTSGIVSTDITILSGDNSLIGTNSFSGVNTFTAIPIFNGGTSGASAPFTVDSNFLVTNLNADQLDGQEGAYYAPLASPTFTGTPSLPTGATAVTQTAGDDSTALATTAYVDSVASTFRGCLVEQTVTGQNISSATETAVSFATTLVSANEVYDTDSIHDLVTNGARLTVPSGVTYVKLSGQIEYDSSIADNTMVILKIHKDGLAFSGIPEVHMRSISYGPDTKYPSLQITSPVIPVTAGSYFHLIVEHKSAGTSYIRGSGGQVWFAMEIIE